MYRSSFTAALFAASALLQAQQVHQVFVLSEGYYDYFGGGGQLIPVTLGSYDPAAGTYQTVATITGPRFGSDVLVDGASVYVAADDRVLRFDADSYQQTGAALVAGVRKLAVWGDALLITRGELGGLPHYFEARDKNTLELLWTIDPADGLTMSAEDVIVLGGKAYLAVNNAFDWSNLAGRVGVVDLATGAYENEIDLGPDGLNPEKLFVHQGEVLAFSNTDFSHSSISRVGADEVEYTVTVSSNSGCGASELVGAEEQVYFLEYAQNELVRFDVASASVGDTLSGSPAVYGLLADPFNPVLYATTTDFVSAGDFHVLALDGSVLSTVPAAVASGHLALDIRLSTGVEQMTHASIAVFPNPADELVSISLPPSGGDVEVLDATGSVVERQRAGSGLLRLSLSGYPAGLYMVRSEGMAPARFTKR